MAYPSSTALRLLTLALLILAASQIVLVTRLVRAEAKIQRIERAAPYAMDRNR